MSEIKQVWGIIKDYQCADLEMVQGPALAVWNHQQAIVDDLKTQLNNMEQCYIQAKKERDELNQWNNNQYELIKRNESQTQSLRHLLQKLIDDSYTTMRPSMAYEIQEALRGEHE